MNLIENATGGRAGAAARGERCASAGIAAFGRLSDRSRRSSAARADAVALHGRTSIADERSAKSSAPPSRCPSGPVHSQRLQAARGRPQMIDMARHGIVAGPADPAARYRGSVPSQPLTRQSPSCPSRACACRCRCRPASSRSACERKARQLGRELKLPGFRSGKVPAPLVIQRVGREAVLEEAVRDTLGNWYSDAIETPGIVPVGDPELDLAELPPRGARRSSSRSRSGCCRAPRSASTRAWRSPRREAR